MTLGGNRLDAERGVQRAVVRATAPYKESLASRGGEIPQASSKNRKKKKSSNFLSLEHGLPCLFSLASNRDIITTLRSLNGLGW